MVFLIAVSFFALSNLCIPQTLSIDNCGENNNLIKWFVTAYNEGCSVSDLKIDYEEYEIELLFYLLPELSYQEKLELSQFRKKQALQSLFFKMAREYSIFWERGVELYSGCVKPAFYGRGINEYDALLLFGNYPNISTLILSIGHNKINKIIINGKDPLDLIKKNIDEKNDKICWRKMISRAMKDKGEFILKSD